MNLVSSALPLPSTQPVNQNVLATETPSQAPAPRAKASRPRTITAIPISGKQKKQEPETAPKTPPKQQQPTPTNRGGLWRAGGLLDASRHAAQPLCGPYIREQRRFREPFWLVCGRDQPQDVGQLVQGPRGSKHTARGTGLHIDFTIARDGSVSTVRLDRSSGSPTLDSSCQRAAQRVDTFGALPAGYNQSTLLVSYYCEY